MHHQCDLYIYDCYDGTLTIHVAASRRVKPWRTVEWDPQKKDLVFYNEPEPEIRSIGLEHDGKTFLFSYDDPQPAIDFLNECREMGYLAPYDSIIQVYRETCE